MGIKGRIQRLIVKPSFREAIHALKNLSATERTYKEVLIIEARYNMLQQERRAGTSSFQEQNIETSRLTKLLLEYVEELPGDLELLHNKLNYLIAPKGRILDVLELLYQLSRPYHHLELSQIRNDQDRYEMFLARENLSSQEVVEQDALQEKVKRSVVAFIQRLDESKLSDTWGADFAAFLLEERTEPIISRSEGFAFAGESSKYLDEIFKDAQKNEAVKRKMLLWQEEYLSGNYQKALEYGNAVRLELDHGSPLVYEYLALSYLKSFPADKMVRQFLTREDESPFQKLMLYIERAQRLDGSPLTTREASFNEIYISILRSIKKLYDNISQDYAFNRVLRGRSKKRELIKRCLDTSIWVHDQLKDSIEKVHPFFEDLLLELEGGDKYLWIKFQPGGLRDRTVYQACSKRKEILKILFPPEGEGDHKHLGEYLFRSLSRKARNLPEAKGKRKAQEQLLLACDAAYHIYKEKQFDRLREMILNEELPPESEADEQSVDLEDDLTDDSEALKHAKRGLKKIDPTEKPPSLPDTPLSSDASSPADLKSYRQTGNWITRPFTRFKEDLKMPAAGKIDGLRVSLGWLIVMVIFYFIYFGFLAVGILLGISILMILVLYSRERV